MRNENKENELGERKTRGRIDFRQDIEGKFPVAVDVTWYLTYRIDGGVFRFPFSIRRFFSYKRTENLMLLYHAFRLLFDNISSEVNMHKLAIWIFFRILQT